MPDGTRSAVEAIHKAGSNVAPHLSFGGSSEAEIIALLTRITRPLTRIGLNPKVLGLSVALVIRFVPVMLLRYDQIALAFRARSPRRPGWRILMPVLLAALDDADRVAEALRARGGAG